MFWFLNPILRILYTLFWFMGGFAAAQLIGKALEPVFGVEWYVYFGGESFLSMFVDPRLIGGVFCAWKFGWKRTVSTKEVLIESRDDERSGNVLIEPSSTPEKLPKIVVISLVMGFVMCLTFVAVFVFGPPLALFLQMLFV